jgi:hypothetical protein
MSIRDDGQGVPLTEVERIFFAERQRGHALVLLRRRLQGFFGCPFQLEVPSEIGEGTTVTMRIPLGKRFEVGLESRKLSPRSFANWRRTKIYRTHSPSKSPKFDLKPFLTRKPLKMKVSQRLADALQGQRLVQASSTGLQGELSMGRPEMTKTGIWEQVRYRQLTRATSAVSYSTIIEKRNLLHVRRLIRRLRSGSAPYRKRL